MTWTRMTTVGRACGPSGLILKIYVLSWEKRKDSTTGVWLFIMVFLVIKGIMCIRVMGPGARLPGFSS